MTTVKDKFGRERMEALEYFFENEPITKHAANLLLQAESGGSASRLTPSYDHLLSREYDCLRELRVKKEKLVESQYKFIALAQVCYVDLTEDIDSAWVPPGQYWRYGRANNIEKLPEIEFARDMTRSHYRELLEMGLFRGDGKRLEAAVERTIQQLADYGRKVF